jgi:hypothetical protein
MKFFATTIPGIAPILDQELRASKVLEPLGSPAFDGRNDLVTFEATTPSGLQLILTRVKDSIDDDAPLVDLQCVMPMTSPEAKSL